MDPKQSNQYDKVIKENLETTLPVIIKDVLKLDIEESEELPDDVQHTKERKPDLLKMVRDADGNVYVLHIEFQLRDEKEMVFRMAEYCIMLLRKYKVPVKQYVIFLDDRVPSMPRVILYHNLTFFFTLISLDNIDYKVFMRSSNPEVKILGILANFGSIDSYTAVESIVNSITAAATGDFARMRSFKQMSVLVQLRSDLEQKFDKIMESVSVFFKEEKDFFYRRAEAIGLVKGEKRRSRAVVENLILKSDMSNKEIADIAQVTMSYVAGVRQRLRRKKIS